MNAKKRNREEGGAALLYILRWRFASSRACYRFGAGRGAAQKLTCQTGMKGPDLRSDETTGGASEQGRPGVVLVWKFPAEQGWQTEVDFQGFSWDAGMAVVTKTFGLGGHSLPCGGRDARWVGAAMRGCQSQQQVCLREGGGRCERQCRTTWQLAPVHSGVIVVVCMPSRQALGVARAAKRSARQRLLGQFFPAA